MYINVHISFADEICFFKITHKLIFDCDCLVLFKDFRTVMIVDFWLRLSGIIWGVGNAVGCWFWFSLIPVSALIFDFDCFFQQSQSQSQQSKSFPKQMPTPDSIVYSSWQLAVGSGFELWVPVPMVNDRIMLQLVQFVLLGRWGPRARS